MVEKLIRAAETWLEQEPDEQNRETLRRWLAEKNETALKEAFHGLLTFGTAGLRGVLGPGSNAMNSVVVGRTAWAIAEILREENPQAAVVIGFDARKHSDTFARLSAEILLAAGLKVHLFDRHCPTPILARAVLELSAEAGIMVTASHNPPQDNGYKLYWKNGAQIIPPVDARIQKRREAAPEFKSLPREKIPGHSQFHSAEILREKYFTALRHMLPGKAAKKLSIAYTPLHGVGGEALQRVLTEAGFRFLPVIEQFEPDGNFPTVKFPNPEEPGALDLLILLMKKERAEIGIASDPDTDRLCAVIRDEKGEPLVLSGNQTGALLADWLLRARPLADQDPAEKSLIATTVVSSSLTAKIAAHCGAGSALTLTGFKWIANRSLEIEADRGLKTILGFEEALGYTVGDLVRDKDGISAALAFALFCSQEDPLEALKTIYARHGFHHNAQKSVAFTGAEGLRAMKGLMNSLRTNPPHQLAGISLRRASDYADAECAAKKDLPVSDLLALEFEQGITLLLRPSGTEPKLKIYGEIQRAFMPGETLRKQSDDAEEIFRAMTTELEKWF